ncbi:hypothetical protein ACIBHX_01895 [Nonomuraea sp. NPDC050536]|uniref:hypothetical protein n=1 Tax=Nonomuraea sp. NPDC050536 TaxID=3364366 RepID=UPI0037CBEBA7
MAKILDLIDVDDPDFGRVASILGEMVAAGVDIDESAVAIATKLGKLPNRKPRRQSEREPIADLGLPIWGEAQQSIVYYIRRGELIKIGTTMNPKDRFADLVPDEILAFEPGDRSVEARRHDQYMRLRKGNSEYFEAAPALMRHIACMRKTHGAPDPRWITVANLSERMPSLSKVLNRPNSPEVASAAAIARMLGLSSATVRAWAHRGQLKPLAGSRRNRPLYFVDHARQLAEESASWSASR